MDRPRTYDVVVFGASGFTGRLIAEYLADHYGDTDLRVALAGRNEEKLRSIRAELAERCDAAREWPIEVADSFDRDALDRVAASTNVVASTVGPFAQYGERLVAACVEHGTHYCDITGEVQFIRRMIDQHHNAAKKSRARIVHCCGFDSIPSDLGTLMMQDEMQARYGVPAEEVRFYLAEQSGAFSGGTVASLMGAVDEAKNDRNVRRMMGNPYSLNPDGEMHGPDKQDQRGVRYDELAAGWTAPFVMAAINTRVVRRSHALRDYPWGKSFRYSEVTLMGQGARGALRSTALVGGLVGFMGALAVPPAKRLLEKRLPKPGEGPSRRRRDNGYFKVKLIATAHGSERPVILRGIVVGQKDPGYGETAKMLGESALCLALDADSLDSEGGVLTPASAMGTHLTDRLRTAGMTFKVL